MGIQGVDLTGMRFGYLTVIQKAKLGYANYKWECLCDCGNKTYVKTDHLKSGNIKSCGCQHFEACKTHGMTETRLYHIWCTMKARCNRPTAVSYNKYGARGISICPEWNSDFQCFYDWSINNGYADDLSIDRIDNNGNYEPQNCRWVTNIVQANNTRANKFIEYNGERLTVSDMARKYNIKPSLLGKRINRGWSVERAIETPRITTFLKKAENK